MVNAIGLKPGSSLVLIEAGPVHDRHAPFSSLHGELAGVRQAHRLRGHACLSASSVAVPQQVDAMKVNTRSGVTPGLKKSFTDSRPSAPR